MTTCERCGNSIQQNTRHTGNVHLGGDGKWYNDIFYPCIEYTVEPKTDQVK